MTGWKIGYMLAPELLSAEIRAIHQFLVFCSATPLQHGIAAGLFLGREYYDDYISDYARKRDLMCDVLEKAGFRVHRPMGTYFVVADYSRFSDMGDREFVDWLIAERGVAAIPTSMFYIDKKAAAKSKKHLRFAFCKSEETIEKAGTKLKDLPGLV
jgi:methionine aminotransferase